MNTCHFSPISLYTTAFVPQPQTCVFFIFGPPWTKHGRRRDVPLFLIACPCLCKAPLAPDWRRWPCLSPPPTLIVVFIFYLFVYYFFLTPNIQTPSFKKKKFYSPPFFLTCSFQPLPNPSLKKPPKSENHRSIHKNSFARPSPHSGKGKMCAKFSKNWTNYSIFFIFN